ncbi:MAG: hypothetical protein JKY25_06555 [Robiginitomaculum sp.]|nr:hypothetical protein [Robiginitomaculum sp.]
MEQYLPIIIALLLGAAGGNIAGKLLKSGMVKITTPKFYLKRRFFAWSAVFLCV